MAHPDFHQSLRVDKRIAGRTGFNPYYLPVDDAAGNRIRIGDRRCFDLASNDYLGLATDARVRGAMIRAVERYGSSLCGTPIATGYAHTLGLLQKALARFCGCEDAAVFPSCYQANCALFSLVVRPEDTVIVDHFSHASLMQGIRATRCTIRPFLHNDTDHLRRQLSAAHDHGRVFVATDSVFSTDGGIAPVERIVDLCGRFDAIPVLDDSHGIGVIGPGGRGILEEKGIEGFPGIYTASLGKALAGAGGVIAGKRELVDYLRYRCPGLIYSTAITPATAAGILKVLSIIAAEFATLGPRIRSSHAGLAETLRECGFRLTGGAAPIASVMCDTPDSAFRLSKALFEHGILSTPFIPPSVPAGGSVVRLIAGAKYGDKALARILERLRGASESLRK